METFSTLLAICAGNSLVSSEFPAQRPMTRSFNIFFDLRLNNDWVNNGEAGDLRPHRSHYDVTVMHSYLSSLPWWHWPGFYHYLWSKPGTHFTKNVSIQIRRKFHSVMDEDVLMWSLWKCPYHLNKDGNIIRGNGPQEGRWLGDYNKWEQISTSCTILESSQSTESGYTIRYVNWHVLQLLQLL